MLRKAAFASRVVASIPDRLPLHEIGRRQHRQNPREDGPVRLQIDQPARARDRRGLGRRFVKAQPQKAVQGERIGGAPGDAALRIDPSKYPIKSKRK